MKIQRDKLFIMAYILGSIFTIFGLSYLLIDEKPQQKVKTKTTDTISVNKPIK